jgi:two-component system sensor histidine kinase ChvG
MALETDRRDDLAEAHTASAVAGRGGSAQQLADRLTGLAAAVWPAIQAAIAWIGRQPFMRFLFGSLQRRIFVANLFGLMILFVGSMYLSQHHAFLIDAKRESLKAQSEIIAAAIAANAIIDNDNPVLDPDKLPEVKGSLKPFRDDAFAALELSIRPERVNPILRRMVQSTTNRARVYTRDGTLIADSLALTPERLRGKIPAGVDNAGKQRVKTKDFWTRLTYWLIDKELPVYKEIGNAKGTFYPEVSTALNGGGTTAMLLLSERGEQIVSVAAPIQRMRSVQGVLLLSTKPGEIDEVLSEERSIIWTLAALALGASIFASLLLARTVARPMGQLTAAAQRVTHSISASHDLPDFAHRTDEIGRLATAFQEMTNALYRRIEASDKFAADVAHELKNPLTAARSTAEALAYAKTDEQREELVAQIQAELKRLNRLISDVSAASRLDAELARQKLDIVPLDEVLEGVTSIFHDKAQGMGVTLSFELVRSGLATSGGFDVSGNDGRLAQVFTNLIDNALSFSPAGGSVKVTAAREGGSVTITVSDDGPGIDEDKLATIFDRFYTYRPTAQYSRGDNSGLGLSISREIIRAHRGEIWAENRYRDPAKGPGGSQRIGASFRVRLPCVVASPQRTGAGLGRQA